MCGILGILNIPDGQSDSYREMGRELAKRIRHRGPDWSGVYQDDYAVICHERLSIVDVNNGAQPLFSSDRSTVLAVNGEIYNFKDLKKNLSNYPFYTDSDCEVIIPLFQKSKQEFLNQLNGIFAFLIYDQKTKSFLVARDHIGIIPLYIGWGDRGELYVASEMKSLHDKCKTIIDFPPGHYLDNLEGEIKPYFKPAWKKPEGQAPSQPYSPEKLRESLEAAVKRQMMSDVPYGVLLSGGLDSSIIAAVASKFKEKRIESDETERAWWPNLHSFAVGLEGSPDLKAAKKVADHLGTVHHEMHFTVQDGIDALDDVIYHLETYDVTTIRASTPMYLMARKIKALGIKMVLSGEGSDEIFGGYLYFHKAPNPQEFYDETIRKIDMLYKYDCLRANKSTAAWGVEARVPFLDPWFLEVAMEIDPSEKMITKDRMEKWVLRKAFEGYIPDEVLWRQKEQFSDGVGYSWIDSLKAYAAEQVSDDELAHAGHRFKLNTPQTKEAYFYRSIFEKHFPSDASASMIPGGPSVACSTPTAFLWDQSFANSNDPSGRAVAGIHNESYK